MFFLIDSKILAAKLGIKSEIWKSKVLLLRLEGFCYWVRGQQEFIVNDIQPAVEF